jgi:50S ribosomal protein L16 3-hydroxylase
VDDLLDEPRLQQRFQDARRPLQANPGELTAVDADKLVDFLVDALPQDAQALQVWLGKYLTEAKMAQPDSTANRAARKNIRRLINTNATFEKNLNSRMLYMLADQAVLLFVDGRQHDIPLECLPFVQYLCQSSQLQSVHYGRYISQPDCQELLEILIEEGIFLTNK